MISNETLKKLQANDGLDIIDTDDEPNPEFVPSAINEKNIPSSMRYKSVDFDNIDNERIEMTWESQKKFTGVQLTKFQNEIKRAVSNNLKQNESITVDIHVFDRNGDCDMNVTVVANGTL